MLESLIDQLNPDGSDEEDDPEALTEFVLDLGSSACTISPDGYSTVIVCAPGAASIYLQALVPSLLPTPWLLKAVKAPERSFPPPPKAVSFLVASASSGEAVAVALLEKEVSADLAFAWSSALRDGFPKASQIIHMDVIARAEWRTVSEQERPQEPHLCGLWTSAWGAGSPCPSLAALPSPNFLGGLPAALLSQCEAANRRCLAAFALQDGAHIMASSLVGFNGLKPLLAGTGLPCEEAPDLVEAVNRVVLPPTHHLGIYA
jgi:hypothetical protein